MRKGIRGIAPILVLLLAASPLVGQVATGAYPYGAFDTPGIDTINVGNLNLHLSIPVFNKAGRGVPFQTRLDYESSIYYPNLLNGLVIWTPRPQFGWGSPTGILSGQIENNTYNYSQSYEEPSGQGGIDIQVNCYYTQYVGWIYFDSSGVVHPFDSVYTQQFDYQDYFPPNGWTCPTNSMPTNQGNASDGSGLTLNVTNLTTATVTAPNGIDLQSQGNATTTTDTNGNQISSDGQGHFTDTTGKVVLTVTGNQTSSQDYTYTDTNGQPQSVSVNYSPYTIQTAFGCSSVAEYGPVQVYLVSSITMPDGSSYTLSYEPTPGVSGNVTGRIAGIQMPQGGTISYSYTGGNNGINCADGSATGLIRSVSSTAASPASSVAYTRTIGTNTSQTTVVDGLGNTKTYAFVEASNNPTLTSAQYYETSRTIDQGSGGTPVLARNTCYNGAASPCTTTIPSLPFLTVSQTETLNGVATNGSTTTFNTDGLQTSQAIDDFASGTSAPGSPLRNEAWTYGYSIPSLVTQDTITDGGNSTAGMTIYGYDTTSLTPSSGVPQHIAAPGPRGNLTSVQSYASSNTSLSSTMTYEDTGSILTAVTPNGTTTYSYDPSFVYLTGETLPTPSSGANISYGWSYDTSNTGLPLTSTDANSQVTHMSGYDSMLRPTTENFPDSGQSSWSWSPTSTSQTIEHGTGTNGETATNYDAYGRMMRTATNDGSNGWYQQDTCYDANGNVQFRSYSYQVATQGGAQICSGAGDTYAYDVLGRVTSVTRADGETLSYTYVGPATRSVDENGVTRISQVDGLGRPSIVCEISSGANIKGSENPTGCGTYIAGTGYVTSYGYNLAAGTTTITQGHQSRVFQSDWLGRPTSITEPESGITTYGYSYNGTGLVVTRQKPQANQTNPSSLTTTTMQYDSLGRVLTTSYSDGTPTKSYHYDTAAGTNFSDLTQTNLVGRLSLASVPNAESAFNYDSMGRVTTLDECLPSGCGTTSYNRKLQYGYDLAGNMTSSTDGGQINNSPVTTTYSISPANEILSMTSSATPDMGGQVSLMSGAAYGPFGPTGYNLANGLAGMFTYDSLGRLSSGGVHRSGSPDYCYVQGSGYKFTATWKGVRLTSAADSVLNQAANYGYDEFNRLTSQTVTAGNVENLSWDYDRYGNRWDQVVTAGSGGPQPTLSFSAVTNQASTNGYAYDAAGNMINDTTHTYTYDADGNIVQVDSGQTATYVYDALNHRVSATVGSNTTEFVFNVNGERVSEWNAATHTQLQGKFYWGSTPLAYYDTTTHFEHQDWEGTERMRTSASGTVEAKFSSLPWGDMQQQVQPQGADTDQAHYATLDYDSESNTDHAQFRQYSRTDGRFLSPDPYGGSYNPANPQSTNRYVYAMNNPLSNIDPTGLECTTDDNGDESGDCYGLDWLNFSDFLGGGDSSGSSGDIYQIPGILYISETWQPFGGNTPSNTGCSDDPMCQGAYQDMFENNQLQFPVFPSSGAGGGGGGGEAPSNQKGCSVLDPNCKKPGPVANYLGFLSCENASIFETISDQEDGQGWTAYGFINAGAAWAVKTKQGNLVGLTFVATAAVMDISAVAKANSDCTKIFY
jgi:RHS repeat-associated protein